MGSRPTDRLDQRGATARCPVRADFNICWPFIASIYKTNMVKNHTRRGTSCFALCVSTAMIFCEDANAFLEQPTNLGVLHAAHPAICTATSGISARCSTIIELKKNAHHRPDRIRLNVDNSDENEQEIAGTCSDAEGLPERMPPKPKNNIWQTIFDPIVTSPILPFILLWGPFLQNPYNKRKWAELTADANPVVVDAFLSSLFISIVAYFAYNSRVEAAEEASEVRELALRDLRAARQGQFSSNKNQQTTSDVVEEAAAAYEQALRKELQLRWISPQLGWRLDFPDDPSSREEDKAAARQFLRLEITDDGNIVELE